MPRPFDCMVMRDREDLTPKPYLAFLRLLAQNAESAAAKAALLAFDIDHIADNHVVVEVTETVDDEEYVRVFVVQCYDGFTVEECDDESTGGGSGAA